MELGLIYREAEITFEMYIQDDELGRSACRHYKHTLSRPSDWVVVLVSSWGEQKKLLGFRFNTEHDWHIAPKSSHWCEDCVAPSDFCSTRSVR